MGLLELNIVGDIPNDLDPQPIVRVMKVLNEADLDWIFPGVVNLKLVDDKAIQALNKMYGGNDYSTDVLSFSYIEDRGRGAGDSVRGAELELEEPIELGDMVVSVETAARQAQVAHTSLADEVATLGLHGILHIFGFDHADEEGQHVMHRYQKDILAQAKVNYRDFKWE